VQILWSGSPAHPLSPSASVDLAHLRPVRRDPGVQPAHIL
jgi:hypothetical protein